MRIPLLSLATPLSVVGLFGSFLPVVAQADSTATGGSVRLYHDAPGNGGGGKVSGGSITAEVTTGCAIAGGFAVSTVGAAEFGGFTGQLFDARSIEISADPGPTLNEGDAVQLRAEVTLDDTNKLNTTDVKWEVQSGPIARITRGGLVVVGAVTANSSAGVQASMDDAVDQVDLMIVDLPFEANPLTWEDPVLGENGPYQVFLGENPGSLVEVGNPSMPHFNPGRLKMGIQYFFQILDGSGTDITPGGPGVQSFTTNLFQPDMRIGLKGNPATHKGNQVYNLTGGGQLAKLTLKGPRKGKLHFSVENDGDTIDIHRVRATKANKKFKFIKYFRLTGGRANITAAAIKSGYVQTGVNPGDVITYQVQAKANGKKRAGQALKIGATSASDARGSDLAKGKLKGVVKK